jgi:hypothetical protein
VDVPVGRISGTSRRAFALYIVPMLFSDARALHRKLVEQRAAALGQCIASFDSLEVGRQGLAATAGQLAHMAVLGSARLTITTVDVWWLEGDAGRVLLVQPFQNSEPLPGEYHFHLSGGLPQPIAHVRGGFFRKAWLTNEDASLLAELESDRALRAATKQLHWARHGAMGHVDLDWTVQLRTLGDETSHLVVQAGSSAFAPHEPLLGPALQVAFALATHMRGDPFEPQGSYVDSNYDALFIDNPA